MRRHKPVRSSSAGFTLIELMVALVISGIVAGVVFDLLLGQTRFARYQNAREEVQQNARAALEVISAELRGVPPEAIIAADANSIQFRLPRVWGILCTDVLPGATTISVRFPAGLFPTDLPTTSPVPNNWGITVGDTAGIVTMAPVRWTPPVTGFTPPTATNCDGAAALQPTVPALQGDDRTFSGATFIPTLGWATIPRGTPVYLWQEVSYDVAASNIPGIWIRRNSQPMAGPVPAANGPNAGLQFTYRTANNLILLPPVPGGDVASIGLTVRTESRAKFNNTPQLQADSTQVYLRNRN